MRRPAPIPGTPAKLVHERIECGGVAVLSASLLGVADNTPEGVGKIRDALDELAAQLDPGVEVSILDVTKFGNAADDACSILTHVFTGLPCCWISDEWARQIDGQRWDLPHADRLAPTRDAAIERVLSWRRAGSFALDFGPGVHVDHRWIDRGLAIRTFHHGALEDDDLWYRNRLVERVLYAKDRARPQRVVWPFPDARNLEHEALRRGARLVYDDDQVIEADLSEYQTRRPLADDWVATVADLATLRTLNLLGRQPRLEDLVRAVRALPALTELRLGHRALSPAQRELLLRERPALEL